MKTFVCCLALAGSLTLPAIAESQTTNILDGVTTNAGGPFTLGDTGPFNFLLITNGGALTNTVGTVGNSNAGFGNVAIVTGAGSVWANAPSVTIGVRGASNQVSVLDGAKLVSSVSVGIGAYNTSIGNHLLVSGANSSLEADRLFLATYSSDNTFTVEQGAHIRLNSITVNSESSPIGRNQILIRNPDTLVSIGELSVGRSPANFVSVSDGAALVAQTLELGLFYVGSANQLDASGLGTRVVASNSLSIGQLGSNNVVTVRDSAELRHQRIDVGFGSSGNQFRLSNGGRALTTRANNLNAGLAVGTTSNGNTNLIDLQGPGTILSNAGYIGIGSAGSWNALSLSGGAAMFDTVSSAGGISVGGSIGSIGNRLVVTGAGSFLSTRFGIVVGSAGSANSLVIADGGRLHSASADVGQNCVARDNLAFITGAGTVWSNGQLQVGFCSTNNHLVVSNGAQVLAGLVRSSVQGGASNTITVTGRGSLLLAGNDLIIGNSGTANSLLTASGGQVQGRNDRMGWSGGNNAATLRDVGTSWSNRSLTIGDANGGNKLTVANGARIDSGGAILGAGANSSGNEATFLGAGSAWNITTNLMLGGLGHSNRLMLWEGASLSARNVYLGAGSLLNPTALFNSDRNTLSLAETNTELNVADRIWIGAYGRFNRLEVRGGGRVNSREVVSGGSYGSRNNQIIVTGTGSVWSNAGGFHLGWGGLGDSMVISQGAIVRSLTNRMGASGFMVTNGAGCVTLRSDATALVTGPGSLWEARDRLWVGEAAIGNSLILSNGGTAVAREVIIGDSSGFGGGPCPPSPTNANRVIVAGGCLVVTNANHEGSLYASFGTLDLRSGYVDTDWLALAGSPVSRLEFAGGTLKVRRLTSYIQEPLRVGDGWRSARLNLTAPVTTDGSPDVNPVGGIIIEPHAQLAGNAVITGPVTNAGIISPGLPVGGELVFDGLLVLASSSVLHFGIGGREQGVNYDYLVARAPFVPAGELRVSLQNGFVPASDDAFEVIGASLQGGVFANAAFGSRIKTSDRLGSFLVVSNRSGVELRDYQSTDDDGDAIEDAWATDYFGHSPLTSAEKLADADGDGASNYDEFRAGTDPGDPASALTLSIAYAGGTATVSFPCVNGKEYRVWSSNDLKTWGEVPDPTLVYPSAGRCDWTNDGRDTGGLGAASRFYRVSVE